MACQESVTPSRCIKTFFFFNFSWLRGFSGVLLLHLVLCTVNEVGRDAKLSDGGNGERERGKKQIRLLQGRLFRPPSTVRVRCEPWPSRPIGLVKTAMYCFSGQIDGTFTRARLIGKPQAVPISLTRAVHSKFDDDAHCTRHSHPARVLIMATRFN